MHALSHAPSPGIGASGFARTWTCCWCWRYSTHLAPALVQVFLHAPGPVVGVGVIPRIWPRRWCKCFCKHLSLALVQALLQALGPRIGAGIIAGTWPQHWCRRYCRHPAPALVQELLQAPGTATMMVIMLVHIPSIPTYHSCNQNGCVSCMPYGGSCTDICMSLCNNNAGTSKFMQPF